MSDTVDVSTLPLARSLVTTLITHGFRFVSELKSLKPLDLAKELDISADDALLILQSVANPTGESIKSASAKEIYLQMEHSKSIITFSRSIDKLLGGGVPLGQLTEFCGVPGIGKTQMAMQLVLDVQIPEILGGVGGDAIYIDTEGSFLIDRVVNMANVLSNHLQKIAKQSKRKKASSSSSVETNEIDRNKQNAADAMTKERLLAGINIFRVHDQTELLGIINNLLAYMALHPNIKLIVIDSIAFHFRQDLQDTNSRNRILSNVAQILNQVAYTYNVGIVLMNHVTTRYDRNVSGLNSRVIPSLGEQWSHCITSRIMLTWSDQQRIATLVKSPSRPMGAVEFEVNENGIRDKKVETTKRSIENE